MARVIATLAAVSAAAEALVAAGEEPTIIRVQQEIGAGSYTTIKKFLDEWRANRTSRPEPVELPGEIAAQGQEFVQSLWQTATNQAEQRVAAFRAESERQVADARQRLSDAEQIIERLEAEAHEREQTLEHQSATITRQAQELNEIRAKAQAMEQRTAELQAQIAILQQRVETILGEKAFAEGAAEALRRQITEQQQIIEGLGKRGV